MGKVLIIFIDYADPPDPFRNRTLLETHLKIFGTIWPQSFRKCVTTPYLV